MTHRIGLVDIWNHSYSSFGSMQLAICIFQWCQYLHRFSWVCPFIIGFAYVAPLWNRRKIKDRPRDPAKWDEIADVVSALSIPVIANGDVFGYEDFKRIKDATGFCFYLPCHLLVCSDKFGSSPLSVSNLETAFFNMHLFGLPQNFNRFLNAVCH